MNRCKLVWLYPLVVVLYLAGGPMAWADWSADPPVWLGGGGDDGPGCPAVIHIEDGSGTGGWAEVSYWPGQCHDDTHDDHNCSAWHARNGTIEVDCLEEDPPSGGTVDAKGTRWFYRFSTGPTTARCSGEWETAWDFSEPQEPTPDGCSHATEDQRWPIQEADWHTWCSCSDLTSPDVARVGCVVDASLTAPGYPAEEGRAAAYHNTTCTEFDVAFQQ